MRTYAWSALRRFAEAGHADALAPLRDWFRTAEKADWASMADVRRQFQNTDLVGDLLIFNIGGNQYRLIVRVDFPYRRLLVRWVGTHAEYDRLSKKDIENL